MDTRTEADEVAGDEAVRTAADASAPAEPTAAPPAPRRSWTFTVLGLGLAVIILAALVVSSMEWRSAADGRANLQSAASGRGSALDFARTYGAYMSSYNYADLNGPTAAWTLVDAHSTPAFRKDFDSTKANLTTLVTDYKATATGKVLAAGLSSATAHRAVAVLFIDQTLTNTAIKPGTATQPLRVQMTMLRQGRQWLIDNVQVMNQ